MWRVLPATLRPQADIVEGNHHEVEHDHNQRRPIQLLRDGTIEAAQLPDIIGQREKDELAHCPGKRKSQDPGREQQSPIDDKLPPFHPALAALIWIEVPQAATIALRQATASLASDRVERLAP